MMTKDQAWLKHASEAGIYGSLHKEAFDAGYEAAIKEALAQPEQALEEDFCFCNDGISLQIVSGGAAVGGLYYLVTLKIDGEYVDYVRAQPAEQEPVGHLYTIAGVQHCTIERVLPDGPLYTSQNVAEPRPKREWVGLTDDELFEIVRSEGKVTKADAWEIVENLQAKLKELNHE